MGYANSKITFDFPELSEEDDLITVTVRNPKVLPLDRLRPKTEVAEDSPDEEKYNATAELLASIVVAWNVYDPMTDELLPVPATAESVRKLPVVIQMKLSEAIGDAVTPPS